jgi:hypothetical protein
MSAVELTDGKQIERGHEESDPAGKTDRMQHQRLRVGHGRPEEPLRELDQQRIAEHHSASVRGCHHCGPLDAHQNCRNSNDESRDWPGDPDVEEPAFVRNRLANANKRADRAR